MIFEYNGYKYSYIKYEDLTLDMLPKRKTYKQSKFLDIGCAFDIETSKIPDEKLSFMYVWQFALNDITIIGRKWEDFVELLEKLSIHYKLSKNCKMLVLVHNLSFEWQFIKNWLQWDNKGVFAMDKRTIVKATTTNFIEFRCSMLLTNMSLEKLATNFDTGLKKLKGDLDYNITRFEDTVLTNEELAYCINDVQILQRFYHSYIKKDFIEKQLKVSLTSTGVVRDELKRNFKRIPKKERNKYKYILQRAMPDEKLYTAMIQWLYRGGFTHCNIAHAQKTLILKDFRGIDEKSCYPAVALQELMPMGFIQRTSVWWNINYKDKKYLKTHGYIATLKFYNIRAKSTHTLESKNKIYNIEGEATIDNGRLLSCSGSITVLLNEIDFDCYELLYTWDKVDCLSCYSCDKVPLPEYVKDLFLKYFSLKEELEDGYFRNKVKARLNSLYGMCVTRIYSMDYVYNNEIGVFDEQQTSKTYEELTKDLILLPQWGVWITSYARRRLLGMVAKINEDDIYNDTDSCKIKNYTGNKWAIDCHNDRIHRLNKNMYVGEYKRELFKDLGCFEDEGKMFMFKTLGAKRYIYTNVKYNKDLGKYEYKKNVTVAGMRKGTLQKYCINHNENIFEAFTNGLEMNPEESEKLTTAYCDTSFTRTLQGHTVHEKSCVTLYSVPFSLTMTKEYLGLINYFEERNKRDFIKRRI